MINTDRLFLREMTPDDDQALFQVLGDREIMQHYPYTFDGQHVRDWIERNMNRYRKDGFGLWGVCMKDTGELIGDCGLTLQSINGELLPEIGYHIRRDCQRKGYTKEAARGVRSDRLPISIKEKSNTWKSRLKSNWRTKVISPSSQWIRLIGFRRSRTFIALKTANLF